MERFRLRMRHEPRRGQIIELHLFPNMPGRNPREADARVMGSASAPDAVQWLRQVSDPYLRQAEAPEPINAADFRPGVPARWLQRADGMRLALAFAAARYLTKAANREMFRRGLEELPAEVVLYWFTLCFYGYRQTAGRAALRTLLTYEQRDRKERMQPQGRKTRKKKSPQRELFPTDDDGAGSNGSVDEEKGASTNTRRRKANAAQ
jgi:hypothetical protein